MEKFKFENSKNISLIEKLNKKGEILLGLILINLPLALETIEKENIKLDEFKDGFLQHYLMERKIRTGEITRNSLDYLQYKKNLEELSNLKRRGLLDSPGNKAKKYVEPAVRVSSAFESVKWLEDVRMNIEQLIKYRTIYEANLEELSKKLEKTSSDTKEDVTNLLDDNHNTVEKVSERIAENTKQLKYLYKLYESIIEYLSEEGSFKWLGRFIKAA